MANNVSFEGHISRSPDLYDFKEVIYTRLKGYS